MRSSGMSVRKSVSPALREMHAGDPSAFVITWTMGINSCMTEEHKTFVSLRTHISKIRRTELFARIFKCVSIYACY
ncbi:hypothetical protein M408DRAFT_185498 [Serendipita vermifera MAFF 305830]|uniref:Uncharacterized protein n=1 Tax=Serendipita vermifera MAFF 305830 TaxID=933852 RepID=A0A0C3BMQ0_SERVB|nr:hypothetical protein M408DRAFT_185498 [Serendipita vermifera MAFF 305830]